MKFIVAALLATFLLICYIWIDPFVAYSIKTLPYNIHYMLIICNMIGNPFAQLILFLSLLCISFIFKKLNKWSFVLFQFTLVIIFSMFICGLGKIIFSRARPNLLLDNKIYGFFWSIFSYNFRSFPSSHAAVAFGIFYVIKKHKTIPSIILWMFASFLAITRIMLCKHYVSDVIVGSIIGMFTAYTVVILTTKYKKDMKLQKLLKALLQLVNLG